VTLYQQQVFISVLLLIIVKETLEDLEITPSQFVLQRRENIRDYYKFEKKIGEGIFRDNLKVLLEKCIKHIMYLLRRLEQLNVFPNPLLILDGISNSSKKSTSSKHL